MLSALSPHVLVAEDEPFVAHALSEFLLWAGCRVTVTHDGLQALEAFAQTVADVVVTDLMMPRLDGVGLIRELRASRPDLPIVLLTGDPTQFRPDDLLGGFPGRTALLAKPVRPKTLAETVLSVLLTSRGL